MSSHTLHCQSFISGRLLLLLCGLLLVCSCFEQDSSARKKKKSQPVTARKDAATDIDTGQLLQRLSDLQDSITHNPEDTALIHYYRKTAFDSGSGQFFSVGTGIANPEFPHAAQIESRTRAARVNGKKWALWQKKWRSGKTSVHKGTLTGKIHYTTHIAQILREDTLVILMATPVGSIELGGEYTAP